VQSEAEGYCSIYPPLRALVDPVRGCAVTVLHAHFCYGTVFIGETICGELIVIFVPLDLET